ncbi:HAD family hydrolase [Paraburkholderia sp. UCT31]|uniref:HAD family hydrolase n=1 Tax=Paraburkholderia sp. UCT31 TaxID=2615209 RepID=UPI001655B693|nr:HAD family hydrolase [Paraburkholderia sp. UCT31]MBC8741874.1 HAD family hydrolase [Paraburkholderia sp. UCT31]
MSSLIAVDGDGVMLDYRLAFPDVWRRAFGGELKLVRPDAYHAATAFGIEWASAEQEAHFYSHFGEDAWSTMPALDGAVEGCHLLVAAGFELVCVTSMNPGFADARKRNLEAHGFPVSDVYAVKRNGVENPKLETLERLRAVALVDDLPDNFAGLDRAVHRALIDYGRFDAPIPTSDAAWPHSTHRSLLDFARFWVSR